MSQTMQNIRRNGGESTGRGEGVISFPQLLEKSREAVLNALPKHMNVDRIMRIALTAFRRNEKLQECDAISVLSAVVQASQLGLEIGQNGEAFLVPYKKECQLIPGYKGLMKLVLQAGHVIEIYAQEVRENDKFFQTYGLRREFVHEPLCHRGFLASDNERGPVTGFYAVAVLKSGERTYVTMSEGRVNEIRNESRGYIYAKANNSQSPWIDDYVSMGMKTVLRALCNKLPMSSDLRTALALDTAANLGVSQALSLTRAADGTYEPPSFTEAYEQQQAARSAQKSANTPSQRGRHSTPQHGTPVSEPAPQAAPAPTHRAPAPKAAPAPATQTTSERSARAPATDARATSPQNPSGISLKDLLEQMCVAKTPQEINDLYLKAQPLCSGRDAEDLNYQYEMAISRVEDKNPKLI